jgi:CubicO group peptidase (beta-lactamase class C family)
MKIIYFTLALTFAFGFSFASHAFHDPDRLLKRFKNMSELAQTKKWGEEGWVQNVAAFGKNTPEDSPQVSSSKYDNFLADKNNLAAIVLKKGKITYERYNSDAGITINSLLSGLSMTKTAAGAVIGQLICEGKIKSLDDTAGEYSKFLSKTPYSNIKIRNILQMNSGVNPEGRSDEKIFNLRMLGRGRKYGGKASVRGAINFYDAASRKQGTMMNYHSSDPAALSVLAEDITGEPLSKTFYERIFTKFSPNGYFHWTSDAVGTTVTFAHLVMKARDWMAFGNYVMTGMKEKTCLGNFFSEGVNTAAKTPSDLRQYGFMSWVYSVNGKPSMVFQGHGGQFMVLDAAKENILLTISKHEKYEAGNLFQVIPDLAERLE